MSQRYTIQEDMQVLHDGSTLVELATKYIGGCSMLVLQRVAVTNETSANSTASIGIDYNGKTYWLETLDLTTPGRYYALKEPVWFRSGTRVVVSIGSGNANDKIKAFVYGYYKGR